MLRHWSQLVPNMSAVTSEDIKQHYLPTYRFFVLFFKQTRLMRDHSSFKTAMQSFLPLHTCDCNETVSGQSFLPVRTCHCSEVMSGHRSALPACVRRHWWPADGGDARPQRSQYFAGPHGFTVMSGQSFPSRCARSQRQVGSGYRFWPSRGSAWEG